MKLILCKECSDVFKLSQEEVRTCSCGKCSGKYTDYLNAWYSGEPAVPIGFANRSLIKAIKLQPQEGMGEKFEAFVIPKDCPTFKKLKNKNFNKA